MRSFCAGIFAAILAFAGCTKPPPPPPPLQGHAHYQLGQPYQAMGHWFYPAESYALDVRGLASVMPAETRLTADGEVFDPTALVAAMQTVQLPAIATVTNLENGRQIDVRINDRGPADVARIIALSPRAAELLLVPPGGAARVRVQIDTLRSHRLTEQVGGGPQLDVQAAPLTGVTAQALPPPGGGASGQPVTIGPQAARAAGPAVPDRLPEAVRQTYADPGQLFLRAGTFGRFDYANVLAARLGGLGATVLRYREGRQEMYAVRAGPFNTPQDADAALRRALGAGVVDAKITVE